MSSDETRRARELLARVDKTLTARPRFDVRAWGERMPEDPHKIAAWLAELPEEEPLPTECDRWRAKKDAELQAAEEAKAKRKARAAAEQRLAERGGSPGGIVRKPFPPLPSANVGRNRGGRRG